MDVQVLILLVVSVVAARIAWRRGARPWAFGFAVFALLPFLSLLKTTHPLVLAAIGSAAVGWVWHRRGSHVHDGDPVGRLVAPQGRRRVQPGHRPLRRGAGHAAPGRRSCGRR